MNVNDLSLTIGEAGVPPCASTTNESRARRRRIRANPMQSAPTVYGWPLQARTNRLPAGQQAVRAGASQYHFLFSFRHRSFSACMITVHQRDNTPLLARTGLITLYKAQVRPFSMKSDNDSPNLRIAHDYRPESRRRPFDVAVPLSLRYRTPAGTTRSRMPFHSGRRYRGICGAIIWRPQQ